MSYCSHCGAEVTADAAACPSCGRPLLVWEAPAGAALPGTPPAPGAPTTPRTSPIVWLVVGLGCLGALVVFGGMMAALLVPNFLDSLQKAKQKRTMADLRSVGVGIEHYRSENGGAPAIGSYGELEALLTPEPLAGVSATDDWDHPLRYECVVPGGPTGCTSYRLGSPGRDGVFDHPSLADYEHGTFDPSEYDADIVYGDGQFVWYPERP